MPVRVPQDVDLEDRLIYGLSPQRFLYLLSFGFLGLITWSRAPLPTWVRAPLALVLLAAGAAMAWGRPAGRPVDAWVLDVFRYLQNNYQADVRWEGPAGAIGTVGAWLERHSRRRPGTSVRPRPAFTATRPGPVDVPTSVGSDVRVIRWGRLELPPAPRSAALDPPSRVPQSVTLPGDPK